MNPTYIPKYLSRDGEEHKFSEKKCQLCDGTGFYPAADGEDDMQMEACDCEAGQELLSDVLAMTSERN